jgi:diguanylate cyclase (GGDEF)-like protein
MAGQLSSTYDEVTLRTHTQTTAINADFLFFIYGIPVLLVICSGSSVGALRPLVWLDIAQAMLASALAYLQIFSALPTFGARIPITSKELMYLYDGENLLLAGAVTLRLLSSRRGEEKRFYEVLAGYLWVYAVTAVMLGYFELVRHVPEGIQDALWGVPYLALLGFLVSRVRLSPALSEASQSEPIFALLLSNLSPVFFTLAIVVMGVRVSPSHSWFGCTCIILAVTLYGIRAALLQSKYVRSQEDLTKAASALLLANERFRELSLRDGLTGIPNRRRFDEALQQEWKRSTRTRQDLSLLMIDIDCFKALNDFYGHQTGDHCLRVVAQNIQAGLNRTEHLVARYGGEEFAIILPGANKEGALFKAEEIRHSISQLNFPNMRSEVGRVVTVSIGICAGPSDASSSPEEFLKRADQALYFAKSNGRNQAFALTVPT